jgi:hypothetical protein
MTEKNKIAAWSDEVVACFMYSPNTRKNNELLATLHHTWATP